MLTLLTDDTDRFARAEDALAGRYDVGADAAARSRADPRQGRVGEIRGLGGQQGEGLGDSAGLPAASPEGLRISTVTLHRDLQPGRDLRDGDRPRLRRARALSTGTGIGKRTLLEP